MTADMLPERYQKQLSAQLHGSPKPPDLPPVSAPAKAKTPASTPKRAKSQGKAVAVPTESQEQCEFVAWFRREYANLGLPSPLLLMASQAGTMLGGSGDAMRFARFAKLKREGFVSGVPDVFIAAPRAPYHGLFIEMKRTKGGTLSDAQKEIHALLRSQEYVVVVARGAQEAKNYTQKYLCGNISNAEMT
jgi:hypothetical protein